MIRVGVLIVRVLEERDDQSKNTERRPYSEKAILRIPLGAGARERRGESGTDGEEAHEMHMKSTRRGTRREGEAHREEH